MGMGLELNRKPGGRGWEMCHPLRSLRFKVFSLEDRYPLERSISSRCGFLSRDCHPLYLEYLPLGRIVTWLISIFAAVRFNAFLGGGGLCKRNTYPSWTGALFFFFLKGGHFLDFVWQVMIQLTRLLCGKSPLNFLVVTNSRRLFWNTTR